MRCATRSSRSDTNTRGRGDHTGTAKRTCTVRPAACSQLTASVPFSFLFVFLTVRSEAQPQGSLHDAVGSRSGELTEQRVCLRPCCRVEGSAVVHSAELSMVEGIIRLPTEE